MRLPLILTAMFTISMTALVLSLPSDSKANAITNVTNTYYSADVPEGGFTGRILATTIA